MRLRRVRRHALPQRRRVQPGDQRSICQLSGVFLTNLSVLCQDPTGTSWFCSCAPGYTGPLCERQVCSANPCLHGGTCIGKWHTLY